MSKSRSNRRQIAENTLSILKQGFFETSTKVKIEISKAQKLAENQTKVYTPQESDDLIENTVFQLINEPTIFEVTSETTLDAVRRLIEKGNKDVLCLNFASAKNPGGGFLGGSQAQEESLARSTGLYPCLLKGKEYYEVNRKFDSCLYTDHIIYSPLVPIFKDEEGKLLDELFVTGIITAPAVNTGAVKRNEPNKVAEIEFVMRKRIEKILTIAALQNHKVLVLGAWGCGVFQNEPEQIAKYFQEILDTKFANVFEKICFAIYANNDRFIKPFLAKF